MRPTSRSYLLYALPILLAAVTGYYLTQSIRPKDTEQYPDLKNIISLFPSPLPKNKPLTRSAHLLPKQAASDEPPPFSIKDERIARFKNEHDYQNFLNRLHELELALLAKSDRLLAVRFQSGNGFTLGEIEDAELYYNYLVTIPASADVLAQPGAVGFGRNALTWLGIEVDNSTWGKGVTVAVLDSGVNDHIALNTGNGKVTYISLTELASGSKQLGHGTAVASIISGDHVLTPGIAPASDILSIRVTDANGSSDSFTLAQGILAAVDGGADIINISMGSYVDSSVVYQAVQYAQQKGVVIVASPGNAGLETVAYPAAYEGVIAVGAIEASGEHLNFSNTGESLDIAAPGYQINAAWEGEQLTSFSGTSASAPFISGAIAATISANPYLTAQQAADLVLDLTNDAGYPGRNSEYGIGILAMDRVIEYGSPGIHDAAITSQVLVMPDQSTALPQVLVTVQNQGTETLINSPISITSPGGTQTVNISSLAPGQIQSFPVPIRLPENGTPVSVSSSVQIMETDQEPDNNSRTNSFQQ